MITKEEYVNALDDENNFIWSDATNFKFSLSITGVLVACLVLAFFLPNLSPLWWAVGSLTAVFSIPAWWCTISAWRKRKELYNDFNTKIKFPTQELHTYIIENAFWEDVNEQVVVTIDGRHYTYESLELSFNIYERVVIRHAFEKVEYNAEIEQRIKAYDEAEERREKIGKYLEESK